MKVCEYCQYRYESECPLCKNHLHIVKKWKALDALSTACFWGGDFELATALLFRRLDLEKLLPHCHKCGWPGQYELSGNEDRFFELALIEGKWQCSEAAQPQSSRHCMAPDDVQYPSASEIATRLMERGIPVEPVDVPDSYEKPTMVRIMNLVMNLLTD